MTPIEQAANKIRLGFSIIDDDTRLGELTDTQIEWLAKVAIVALREPSEAMAEAGGKAMPSGSPFGPRPSDMSSPVWQAMIDAALGEG